MCANTNDIYFRAINYCDKKSCIACLTLCVSKSFFGKIFCNCIFDIIDQQLGSFSRHILLILDTFIDATSAMSKIPFVNALHWFRV